MTDSQPIDLWQSILDDGGFLTIEEVAAGLKVHPKTVYRWIADHKLGALIIGNHTYRVTRKDINEFLNQNRIHPYKENRRVQA